MIDGANKRLTAFWGGLALAISMGWAAAAGEIPDPENTLLIEVGLGYESVSDDTPERTGTIVLQLRPDLAPNHAARLKELAAEGFYNDVPFHRVIPGFMAQTGDGQNGNGTGGSDKEDLRSEFTGTRFERGVVGMARTSYEHSANSQFFIMFEEAPHLNGQYTIVGQVIEGMDVVDAIKLGEGQGGAVDNPDRMISVTLAAAQ